MSSDTIVLKSPASIMELLLAVSEEMSLSKSWMKDFLGLGRMFPCSRRSVHCWEKAVLGPTVFMFWLHT